MYVLLLLIVLVMILLSWTTFENAIKGFIIFIIGYYIGKNFDMIDRYAPAGLETGLEPEENYEPEFVPKVPSPGVATIPLLSPILKTARESAEATERMAAAAVEGRDE